MYITEGRNDGFAALNLGHLLKGLYGQASVSCPVGDVRTYIHSLDPIDLMDSVQPYANFVTRHLHSPVLKIDLVRFCRVFGYFLAFSITFLLNPKISNICTKKKQQQEEMHNYYGT